MPCIHTAPSLRKVGDKWKKYAWAPPQVRVWTVSPPAICEYGVRAIIGKGGLYQGSLDAMQKYGAVYLAIVGGAAALETEQIEEVEAVYFEELHPEALYRFRVKNFGPLTVAMDSHGVHLYDQVTENVKKKLPKMRKLRGIVGMPFPPSHGAPQLHGTRPMPQPQGGNHVSAISGS